MNHAGKRFISWLLILMLLLLQCGVVYAGGAYLEIEDMQTEYRYGEEFNAILRYTTAGGKSSTVHSDECEVIGFDSFVETTQEQRVIIEYMDARITCEVTVVAECRYEWMFDESKGELIIRGEGEIPDFHNEPAPWVQDFGPQIKTVTIEGEITSIGNYAFLGCEELETVDIAAFVTTIKSDAFADCFRLRTVFLPESIQIIETDAFLHCDELTNVFYMMPEEEWNGRTIEDENIRMVNAISCHEADILINCRTSYNIGEEFDAKVIIRYRDGLQFVTDAYILEGFNSEEPGEYAVIIRFGQMHIRQEYVTVSDEPIVTVQIRNVKTDYEYGEEFYAEVYECVDGMENPVPLEECMIEGFDPYTEGEQTVTVTYLDCQETFEVVVREKQSEETELFEWNFNEDFGELTVICVGVMPEYPEGCYPWSEYSDRITTINIAGEFDAIKPYMFANCNMLTDLYIDAEIDEIQDNAFISCHNLRNVSLPHTLKWISDNAFMGCDGIVTVLNGMTEEKWHSVGHSIYQLERAMMYYGCVRIGSNYIAVNVKREYQLGEEFTAELYRCRTLSGRLSLTPVSIPLNVLDFDSNISGRQEITLEAGGYASTIEVYVKEPELVDVLFEIIKEEYELGEDIELAVHLCYSDGREEIVYDYTVEGYDKWTVGEQYITVSYEDYSGSFTVIVKEPEPVVTIAYVDFELLKSEYELGEEFLVKARVLYSDDTEEYIDSYTVEGFDSKTPGEKRVTVSYEGYSETFTVYVNAPEVKITDVDFGIKKTEYELGEDFEVTVIVSYSDGTMEETDAYTVEGFDSKTPGEKKVTVSYEGYSYIFTVYVKAPEVKVIGVDFENVKEEYEYGEKFSVGVLVRYSDGTVEYTEDYTVEGFDSYTPGKQVVKVMSNGYYKTFNVTVKEKEEEIENAPVVSVSAERCKDGNTVDVVVSISGNTGFSNLGLEIEYDRALTLVGAVANSGVGAIFTAAQTYDKYPYNIGFDTITNSTYNGELVTLTFEVPEGTAAGEYFVNVDFYKGNKGNYTDGDDVNYDADQKPLGLRYENGSVTVYNYIPGDINGDGKVNNKDGTSLLRYLAGWEIDVVDDALDTDGNGSVSNKDGTRLLQYLAGWNVTVN